MNLSLYTQVIIRSKFDYKDLITLRRNKGSLKLSYKNRKYKVSRF